MVKRSSTAQYSEDTLVEQPAIELLAGLGWQTIGAFDEVFGKGGTLGRDNMGEVVLLRHLVPAIKKLNPKAPPEAIGTAVNELTRDRCARWQRVANIEVYALPRLNPGALDASELKMETGASAK